MTLQQLRYVTVIADSGSMNEAARELFVSQPGLSGAVKELEEETGIQIFRRTNKGVCVTPEGEEFLGYARQLLNQYQLMEDRFVSRTQVRKKFSVSMQHYSFAVKAFVELVRQYGMDEYEFAVYETKTADVISDVRNFRSELGILYQNEFNRRALNKLLRDNNLEFHELFTCGVYVYLWRNHPLADRPVIRMDELREYPCLMFDQGANPSFFLSEEVMSTYDYKRVIRTNDRASMLNLMVGLNGYTLCSGIICEELNGSDYRAVPLGEQERMVIGYIQRSGMVLGQLANRYLEEIRKYESYTVREPVAPQPVQEDCQQQCTESGRSGQAAALQPVQEDCQQQCTESGRSGQAAAPQPVQKERCTEADRNGSAGGNNAV